MRAQQTAIAEIEGMDRDRYAGPVGWIDASGDGEWGIALRSAVISEEDPNQVRLFAGCGIVAASDPQTELAESEAKLQPMRQALRPRACPLAICDCHIGYVHLETLPLYDVFAGGVLERIPAEPPPVRVRGLTSKS